MIFVILFMFCIVCKWIDTIQQLCMFPNKFTFTICIRIFSIVLCCLQSVLCWKTYVIIFKNRFIPCTFQNCLVLKLDFIAATFPSFSSPNLGFTWGSTLVNFSDQQRCHAHSQDMCSWSLKLTTDQQTEFCVPRIMHCPNSAKAVNRGFSCRKWTNKTDLRCSFLLKDSS